MVVCSFITRKSSMKLTVSLQVAFRWKVWTNLPCEPKPTGPASRSRVKTPVENLLESKHKHHTQCKIHGIGTNIYLHLVDVEWKCIYKYIIHTWMVWEMYGNVLGFSNVTWRIIPWLENRSNQGDCKSPKNPSKWPFMAYTWGLRTSYCIY